MHIYYSLIPKKIFERIFKLLKSKNKNKKNIKIFLIGFCIIFKRARNFEIKKQFSFSKYFS